jgi:glycosyltransferase involved in cell wall biosynthesis
MGHSDKNICPLVTVIAGCYNHARFLRECLDSILSQSYTNIQLIITDDCSLDGSPALIDSWIRTNGVNCQFLKHEKNLGLCKTVNEALSLARGKYISGVSTDDVWLPGKLQTQVELMEQLPDKVGVIYSDALQMDEEGNLLEQTFIDAHRRFGVKPTGKLHEHLWEGNFIPAMTALTRRECFDRVGLYDETLFYEDWDMWLRIARQYEFYYSDAVSAQYRIVSNSMAHGNPDKMLLAGFQMCRKHIEKGWVTKEALPHVGDRLYFCAEQSYKRRLPEAKEIMELALKHDRKFRTRFLSYFAKLGIPYDYFAKTRRLIKSCLLDKTKT